MNNFSERRQAFSLNRIDFTLLVPGILLVFISLATLYSIDINLFKQQAAFFGVSLLFYFIFLNIDYRFFGLYAKFFYVSILVGLFLILIFGTEINASKSWFNLFGVHLQFSEVAKPFFIIITSFFLAKSNLPRLLKLFATLGLFFPIFFLILRQPDLGTAAMYLASLVGMLFMYGFPIRYFIASIILFVLPSPLLFNFLKDYQRNRILTFLNTTQDPYGSSYNAIQSLISIGSGGFFGKGLGQGTQSVLRFLPERHTDFIFASIAEGMGFVGGISIICLFCFLLYRIYSCAKNVNDLYPFLIIMGSFFLFFAQMLVNIGMNLGIMPIVGITLPLVSYGGSSLLTSFIMLGIISSISFDYRKHETIEIV